MPGIIEAIYQPFSLFCVHVMLWQRQRGETPGRRPTRRSSGRRRSTGERYVANVDLAKLGVGPGDRVVDLGCGEGALAELLARAGLHVTGVEPAAYLRERFAARLGADRPGLRRGRRPRGPAAVRRRRGRARSCTTEVLEHVPDPEAALRELHRAMRPGAVLCLSVPTSFTELLFWRLHPRYAENATHLRIFTKPELRAADRRRAASTSSPGRAATSTPRCCGRSTPLLRTPSDHTGQILGNAWMTRVVDAGWRALQLVAPRRRSRSAPATGSGPRAGTSTAGAADARRIPRSVPRDPRAAARSTCSRSSSRSRDEAPDAEVVVFSPERPDPARWERLGVHVAPRRVPLGARRARSA